MRLTLRGLTKKGVKEYHEMPREQWILQQPAQLVIIVSNVFWCQVRLAVGCEHTGNAASQTQASIVSMARWHSLPS
jgi:hypothetical protein